MRREIVSWDEKSNSSASEEEAAVGDGVVSISAESVTGGGGVGCDFDAILPCGDVTEDDLVVAVVDFLAAAGFLAAATAIGASSLTSVSFSFDAFDNIPDARFFPSTTIAWICAGESDVVVAVCDDVEAAPEVGGRVAEGGRLAEAGRTDVEEEGGRSVEGSFALVGLSRGVDCLTADDFALVEVEILDEDEDDEDGLVVLVVEAVVAAAVFFFAVVCFR